MLMTLVQPSECRLAEILVARASADNTTSASARATIPIKLVFAHAVVGYDQNGMRAGKMGTQKYDLTLRCTFSFFLF